MGKEKKQKAFPDTSSAESLNDTSELLSLNFSEFRLKSLAEKIKSKFYKPRFKNLLF